MGLLREGDRERYLTVLFSPEDRRAALAALYAFNLETARVRDLVSEPMPGEIRLQWWREVVTGEREGEGRQHPVGAALLDAKEAHGLSAKALANLVEARIFDLYNDPMPDRASLEGYLGETASALFQLSALILDADTGAKAAEAAGHAGVAYGISGLLRLAAAASPARAGLCARRYSRGRRNGCGRLAGGGRSRGTRARDVDPCRAGP